MPAPAGAASGPLWLKVCEKTPIGTLYKDGKEETRFGTYCLTQHEVLDGTTGFPVMSAAVRQIDGEPTPYFVVLMPLNVRLQAGMRAALYPKEFWEPALKNQKVDESKLKALKLEYSLCHRGGCTAQLEAPPELINDLKSFGGIAIFAINALGEAISFPVPLAGFAEAYAGAPVDAEQYAAGRRALVEQLAQQRQRQLAEQQKKQAQPPSSPAPAPKK